MKIAANYEITGIRVNPVGGSIEALEINHEEVSVGAASLQDNKAATIDVSTYTEPVEITPTAGKEGMKKATITLSNIPSGADLEANKEATIDVSNYSTPVEITPTEGKDGMEKVTVTLNNIPSGGNSTLYAWKNTDGTPVKTYYMDTAIAPEDGHALGAKTYLRVASDGNAIELSSWGSFDLSDYEKVSDTVFKTDSLSTYERYPAGDITLW